MSFSRFLVNSGSTVKSNAFLVGGGEPLGEPMNFEFEDTGFSVDNLLDGEIGPFGPQGTDDTFGNIHVLHSDDRYTETHKFLSKVFRKIVLMAMENSDSDRYASYYSGPEPISESGQYLESDCNLITNSPDKRDYLLFLLKDIYLKDSPAIYEKFRSALLECSKDSITKDDQIVKAKLLPPNVELNASFMDNTIFPLIKDLRDKGHLQSLNPEQSLNILNDDANLNKLFSKSATIDFLDLVINVIQVKYDTYNYLKDYPNELKFLVDTLAEVILALNSETSGYRDLLNSFNEENISRAEPSINGTPEVNPVDEALEKMKVARYEALEKMKVASHNNIEWNDTKRKEIILDIIKNNDDDGITDSMIKKGARSAKENLPDKMIGFTEYANGRVVARVIDNKDIMDYFLSKISETDYDNPNLIVGRPLDSNIFYLTFLTKTANKVADSVQVGGSSNEKYNAVTYVFRGHTNKNINDILREQNRGKRLIYRKPYFKNDYGEFFKGDYVVDIIKGVESGSGENEDENEDDVTESNEDDVTESDEMWLLLAISILAVLMCIGGALIYIFINRSDGSGNARSKMEAPRRGYSRGSSRGSRAMMSNFRRS